MWMTTFITLIFLASNVDIGSTAKDRILGGADVVIGEYPYVAAITVNGNFKCGGFIYNERWIVTAASCVIGVSPSLVTVQAGTINLSPADDTEQRSQVISIHTYASYVPETGLHDIALIEIVPAFKFNSYVNFVYYDQYNDKIVKAIFIGWGSDGDSGFPSSQLKKATLSFQGVNCPEVYGDSYNSSYMICCGTPADNQSPCQFDEGSPLIQNGYAIGIMSKNKGCGPPGSYDQIQSSIFTRLSSYYNWIASTAGQQPFPARIPTFSFNKNH